jgi:hypothetical protein
MAQSAVAIPWEPLGVFRGETPTAYHGSPSGNVLREPWRPVGEPDDITKALQTGRLRRFQEGADVQPHGCNPNGKAQHHD